MPFMQLNNDVALGAPFATPFSDYSQPGGTQYEIGLGFYFYQHNWWLAVGGQWVGYYPGALYGKGQMSQFAQKIDFGGETAGISPTIDKNAISHDWAAMGSGKFAAEGYAKAAYQRQIIFRDAGNLGHVPTLMVAQPLSAATRPRTQQGARRIGELFLLRRSRRQARRLLRPSTAFRLSKKTARNDRWGRPAVGY